MWGITEVAATWPKNVCTEERELEGGLGSNCVSEPGTAVPRGLHPFPSGLPPACGQGRPATAEKAVAGRGQQPTGHLRSRHMWPVCAWSPGSHPLGVSAAAVG